MIKFGTSGWRAVMGEEFTFHNVRVVVQAAANYLLERYPDQPVSIVVNYDTRFLSERYAFEAAKVLSRNRIRVLLSDRDAPSQAQAYQIIKRGCQGGINFTASFNPPEYNGLKFNTHTGAPALPEVTDRIEEEIQKLDKDFTNVPAYPRTEHISRIDLQADYLEFLQKKIDFDLIRRSGIKVGVDLLFGTSREYLDEILERNGIPIEEIHGYVDPYFGGVIPSCTEENLRELKRLVRDKKCDLGVATDADGDRFGILDQAGNFIHQNEILAVLLEYLVVTKGWRGGVARSVTTTRLIDRIARRHGLEVHKTPVGFKYMADLFLQGKIIFGGEESACIAVKDHLPEKDGIFAGLLVCEMIAASGRNLSEIRKALFREYGTLVGGQRTLPRTPAREKRLREFTESPPSALGAKKVEAVEIKDGINLEFADDAWLHLRFSGTEPVIRCYAEAASSRELDDLLARGMEFVS
ncbi:MAG TPA: phosphoglucomutase/phosphomannomutase family protein [Acidobacteriota bacterium]|nr:phosphoglucomutase/phosphomannomutase family protein [Acidobacteriota bacterium]